MIIPLKAFLDISQWPTPSDVEAFVTHGHYAFGDGGGGEYKRIASIPSHPAYEISATGGIFELTNRLVTPEMYGAVGNGVADDTDALMAMGDHARTRGFLHSKWQRGKTYTHKNPRMFEGIRDLRIDAEGASLMNIRAGTSYAHISEMECLVFPGVINSSGHSLPFNFSADVFGDFIATVEAGVAAVTTLSSPTCNVGDRVLVYGCNGMNTASYPPAPRVFEFNRVIGISGSVVTLAETLQNSYDSRWPDGLANSVNKGAPRILSLDRGASFTFIETLKICGLTLARNPIWSLSDPLNTDDINGRIELYGSDLAVLENCKISGGAYVSQSRHVTMRGTEINATCEVDKIIDSVEFDNCKARLWNGATGAKQVRMTRCRGTVAFPTPIDTLHIEDCNLVDTAPPSSSLLMGQPISGTRLATIERTSFSASGATKSAITTLFNSPVIVYSVVNSTTFDLGTQAQYETNVGIYPCITAVMRVGIKLYSDAGVLVMKVTKLPYLSNGRILVEGVVSITPSANDTLYAPMITTLELSGITIKGPRASAIVKTVETFGSVLPMLTERNEYSTGV